MLEVVSSCGLLSNASYIDAEAAGIDDGNDVAVLDVLGCLLFSIDSLRVFERKLDAGVRRSIAVAFLAVEDCLGPGALARPDDEQHQLHPLEYERRDLILEVLAKRLGAERLHDQRKIRPRAGGDVTRGFVD